MEVIKTETPQPVYILEPSAELNKNLSTVCQDPVIITDKLMAFYHERNLKGKKKKIP